MKILIQNKNYNCGVFCVHFFLGLYGISIDPKELERIMETTEEDGTSHEGIKKAFRHFNFKWVEQYESRISSLQEFLPAIVNYQYCDEDGCDGHYCVILGQGDGFFVIYNPATGEIETLNCEEFKESWHSERYGKGWFIQPIKELK